jgi:hypothetical protein
MAPDCQNVYREDCSCATTTRLFLNGFLHPGFDYAIHNLVLECAMAEDRKENPKPPTPSGEEEAAGQPSKSTSTTALARGKVHQDTRLELEGKAKQLMERAI